MYDTEHCITVCFGKIYATTATIVGTKSDFLWQGITGHPDTGGYREPENSLSVKIAWGNRGTG